MTDDSITDQHSQQEHAAELWSYAVDLRLDDPAILTDRARLTELLRAAAESGNARVLGETSHVFPNGAITLVLLLSQSHLSIHTWPEFRVANVDLFAYGRANAERMLAAINRELAPVSVEVRSMPRTSQ